MRKNFLVAMLCVLLFLSGCSGEEKISNRQIYTMDTLCSVTVYGEESTTDKISEELYRLDNVFSAYDGEVEELNLDGGGEMSESLCELLLESTKIQWETGTFSPHLGSVIELWGIGGKNYVPAGTELSEALVSAGIYNIEVRENMLTLKNGAKLNFGAVAKGYASDKIREILKDDNVKSAMISLGGNVYVHGKKPDGSLWRVGIRNPRGSENDWFCTLSLEDKFIISSGDYERYFEKDGKRYHHIIDPNTGYPAESDLLSVTVVSESGVWADGYSTALYIMGSEDAIRFWREKEGFELVLVCRDGRVIVTEGLSDSIAENREAGYIYETASR